MIHEMAGGIQGKAKDLHNDYKKLAKLDNKLNKHLSEFTGQPLKKIEKDVKLDFWMNPEEAKEYGLIDKVHYKRGE
jgi:ATP-dependent Clp protease protease subunit